MRHIVTAMLVVSSVSPASGFAAPMSETTQTALAPTRTPGARLGTHAVTGMVISVSPSRLVIVCSGKNATEMTFVLNPSTRWEGALTAGTVASVRFVTERRALVATGVFVLEHRTMSAHQAAARASPTVNRQGQDEAEINSL